jgi:hypothetical protein
MAQNGELRTMPAQVINRFLSDLPEEHRFALLVDQVEIWGQLGATPTMLQTLKEVTGL